MITYYYKSLRTASIEAIDDVKRGTWVYVEAPSTGDLAVLVEKFNLEPGILEDAADTDEVPRLEREEGVSYIFVRFPYKKANGEVDTAPLLIVFGGEYVITISPVHLPALDYLQRGRIPFATTQRAKLVLLILSHSSDQFDVYINQTSRKLKSIRTRLRGHSITDQDLIDFVTIEDELNEFLSSLQPNNATLRRLLSGKHIPLFEEDQDIVEDILLSNEQSIEASQANIKSISNIRDAYSAIASNKLNRTLTILTIATILISVPSLAMGVYSLNIPLPAQHSANTFWVIMGINVTLMITVLIVAKKKRVV
ncbi:MAG TPA: magnesium transporter CorA family protein [Candidatus Saccharimonadales bacterium]|nr:magnesium transporter CorA family protein [Candidatus Saccharimonadales bacterium]